MMSEPLVVYRCALCHVYLDNYTKATIHLGMKHSEALRINNINKRKDKDGDGDFIKAVGFPELVITLEPIVLEPRTKVKTYFQTTTTTSTTSKSPKRATIRKSLKRLKALKAKIIKRERTPGRQEIKLDPLKAGEIETLVTDDTDLLSNPSSPKTELESDQTVRRSSRKVKERFNSNYDYELLDEECDDEEFVQENKTGRLRDSQYRSVRKKRKPKQDTDFDPNSEADPTIPPRSVWWCRICEAEFPERRVDYLEHMRKEHLKNGKYTCTYCNLAFYPLEKFSVHMNLHLKPKPPDKKGKRRWTKATEDDHKCKICGKVLKILYEDRMADHLRWHELKSAKDPNKPHECPVCHHRFPYQYNLQRHFVMHLENNPYKCEFLGCGRKFNGEYNLKRHMILHTDRVLHKCKICTANFATGQRLTEHNTLYHSKNSTKVYKRRANNKFYIKSTQELAPEFTTASASTSTSTIEVQMPKLEREDYDETRFELESVHLDDNILEDQNLDDIPIKEERLSPKTRQMDDGPSSSSPKSQNCIPHSFSQSDEQNGQLQWNKKSKFPVNQGELFSLIESDPVVQKLQENNPHTLDAISRTRSFYNISRNNDDFKCQICTWTGARASSFQRHMQICHGAGPAQLPSVVEPTAENPLALGLTCGSCGYLSKSSDDLSTHFSEVHAGTKKFPCSHCGLRFGTSSRRDKHIRVVHLTEKKFKCDKCDGKYISQRSLAKHMAEKHDAEYQKEFQEKCTCKICGKVLSNKLSWMNHIRSHTEPGRQVVSCKICGQNCATPSTLKRHIQYVHLGVKNPYNRPKGKSRLVQSSTISESQPIDDDNIGIIGSNNSTNETPALSNRTGEEVQQLHVNKNQRNPVNRKESLAGGVNNFTDVCKNPAESLQILGF